MMTRLIIALLIKDHKNTQSPLVRTRYGMVSGIVGLVCNALLSAVKFFLGAMSGSIAVTADAVNNLSDCGSSAVTLIGFKMASKPADNEHPYGHGRIEYIAGLIVSFMIMYAGFEILKSSVIKIINPMPVASSLPVIIGLCASILVKLWLNRFNNTVSKRISSSAVSAAAADSVFDVLATGATLVSVIASGYTDLPMDGIAGILVSAIILYAGVGIIRDTLSPLLGRSPSPELVGKIKDMVLSYDGILGVHDLIV
ncbi:MAG: cation transporter, partial [Clostridiales bacterium]|nr:cation transporter [Clostridiales bacterium]